MELLESKDSKPEIVSTEDGWTNVIISSTYLDFLEECATKYQYGGEMGLISAVNVPIYFIEGTIGHAGLAHHYSRIYENLSLPEDKRTPYSQIMDEAMGVMLVESANHTIPTENVENIRTSYQQYATHYFHDSWVPLLVPEGEFTKVLFESPELKLRIIFQGKIDLFVRDAQTNESFPVDHKFLGQKTIYPRLSNQALGYGWATDSSIFVINKVGKQKSLPPQEKFERQIITITPEHITKWIEKTINNVLEYLTYKAKGYIPKKYAQCSNRGIKCAFYDVCDQPESSREDILRIAYKVNKEYHMGRE